MTNIKTMPYPGVPTDLQPQMTTALCLAEGTSIVTEGVWDSRYRYVGELTRILRLYGEERFAPQIARAVVREREKAPI